MDSPGTDVCFPSAPTRTSNAIRLTSHWGGVQSAPHSISRASGSRTPSKLTPTKTCTPTMRAIFIKIIWRRRMPTERKKERNEDKETAAAAPFWLLTDVIHRSRTEFRIEDLDAERLEVFDDKWPNVEHIVPRKWVSLFDHDNSRSEQLTLDAHSEAAGTATNDKNLKWGEEELADKR